MDITVNNNQSEGTVTVSFHYNAPCPTEIVLTTKEALLLLSVVSKALSTNPRVGEVGISFDKLGR